jgi:hypothetical protein
MDERAPDMNAEGAAEFLRSGATFQAPTTTSDQRRTYLLVERPREMVMPSFLPSFLPSSSGLRISRLAITASLALATSSALAAQGPGVEAGSASPLTQSVMAVLVYGASALVVGAGLIGALRGN